MVNIKQRALPTKSGSKVITYEGGKRKIGGVPKTDAPSIKYGFEVKTPVKVGNNNGGHINPFVNAEALEGWWCANCSPITRDSSGYISQWNDLSKWQRHLTATTTARPLYSIFNKKPAVLFDGTSDVLRADGVATRFSGDDKPITVCAVYNTTSLSASGKSLLSFGKSGGAGIINISTDGATNRLSTYKCDDSSNALTCSAGTNTVGLHYMIFTTTGKVGGFYQDGFAKGTLDQNLNVTPTTLNVFGVGALMASGSASEYMAGYIMELAVFSRVISREERKLIEAYLHRKWT